MAQFSKSIKILKDGTTYTVPVFSTSAEAGSSFTGAIIIDSTQGYYPLCSTSDSKATPGRCLHSNGTTYALAKSGAPAYTYKLITTAGSGTFTVPSGVTKLRVTCVGGGAGGIAGSSVPPDGTSTVKYAASTAGGKTTFGSVSANGATYASITFTVTTSSSESGTSTDYTAKSITVSKGYTNGGGWINSDYHDAPAATPLVGYNGTQRGTAGRGGCADGGGWSATGASGYRTVSTITVTPGQSISYTVGNYGKGWKNGSYQTSTDNSSGGVNAGRGYAGAILVEYGVGIQ